MQQPKTTRKRLPKRGAHARALAAAAALENRDVDLDDDEMSHTVLQRGSACLSCRKRKLKCDAVRPACRKCVTAGRADECNYDDGKQKTRTQLLQEKVKELEEKLLTLEAGSIGSDDDGVGSDQPPALAPAIIALPDGTIQSNGHAPNQMMNGYPQSLFDEPSQNAPAHFDALLNRDTGTLQVFGQQDHSANNLLDVTSGPVPSWLGDFTGSFEGSPTTDTAGTGFSGISLARAVGSPGDSSIDRQLTAYLSGSAMTSGTNVGFSSMALPPGQTTVPSQFIDITASYGVVPDPALSFTLDAFPDIDGVPARWLDQDQLPTNIRNYLIDLFMPHRHRCGFEVHIGRFLASLDLPINKRPHPCLMNAIYLLGCHYAPGGALSHLEPMFLSKARASLAESLEHADRLKDFLFASALLACYFYFKGRLLEGQHHNSAAVRFAMSCGLHQISSPVWRGSEYATTATGSAPWQVTSMSLRRAGSMLDPPRDPIELYELINIFWLTFITDRAGSLGTGLPHAIKDSEITTVFPRPLKEFEDGTISDETNATIMNMYEQGNHAQDASKDSLHALRVKSLALLERSSRLSMVPESERTSTFWHEFRATDMALDRISKTLPHIHSGMGINDTSSLIFVHTFVQGSTIQLHSQFVDADQTSYDRSVRAADAAMQVVHLIDNIDAKNFHMLMGLSWICVADVLKREIQRKRSISDEDGARHTEQELEALFAVMKRLRQVYPVLELTVFDQWDREALRLNTRETRGSKEDAASLTLNCTMLNSTPSTASGPSTPSAVSRPSTASITNQRRARRAQPYTPTSVILTPEHESGPQIGLFDSPGSTLGSSVVHQSSRTSTDSPSSSSSPSEGTSGGVSHPSSVLQRGSACLTCRRRKLKCDANKPACTACTRAGRSQTCSYDDGLPKSRVQILTSKVRDLEAKISAMETARQTALADTSYQAHPLFMPADTLSCTPGASGSSSGASTALLSHPYLPQDSQAWAPYVPEQNELLNLAASLAIPNSEPLAHTRNELLGTLRKLTPWWELDEIPSGMQRYLIDVFLARKWEPGVGIDAPRLWASLSLPMADQHHKCFLNAMYLVACSFAGDKSFDDMQPTFVVKVRKEMEAALVQGDRLIDFIRASNLLSFYYFLKGRFLEGHHLSSTAARFAIACGLHQLGSPQWQPQSEYGRIDNIDDRGLVATSPNALPRAMCTNNMVPRPRDNIEKNEYIHAYWTVHMHDMGSKSIHMHPRICLADIVRLLGRLVGLLTGLATSVADSEVNTPWPTPLDSVPLPSGQFGQPTVVSLYSGIPGTADMSRDSHSQSLRVKSMCLLTRAAKLSAAFDSARYLEPGLLAKHEACDRALIEALQTMPMESTHTDLEWTTMIAAARTTLLTGQVQLHGFLASKRRESREKCLIAANEALDVLRRLRLIAVPEALLLLLVVDWIILKEWYMVEKSRLLAEGNMLAAELVEQSIQELLTEIGSVPAIPTVSGLKH